ncbi:MAG: glycosyltransferase family 2 protein [Planctomycetota bacterium]
MSLLLYIWVCITVVALAVWMSRHLQISRATRLLPPIHAGMHADNNSELPALTVLVAAKDEEDNIEACLQSLLEQDYPELQVVAINDRSSDRTAEIIDRLAEGDDRLTAVHVHELRDGWFGKNNAMREGMASAGGEWLCFTDADCCYTSPRALTVAMRYALENGSDFLSVLPTHQTDSFWERVIQPACSGILMIWFNPLKVNDEASSAAYANGAFMLMNRSCYDRIGGHEPVKAEVNEDMHMARLTKGAGLRLRVVTNENLYQVRMYATLPQIWAGWTRIFYGCFGTLRKLFLSMLAVATFGLLPWVAFFVAACALTVGAEPHSLWLTLSVAAAVTCLAEASVMVRFYALSQSGSLYGLMYPLGAIVGLGVLANAMRRVGGRKSVTWRGTTYRGETVTSGDGAES